MAETQKFAGVSSDAVKKATGKTWQQWLALLDQSGARELAHKDIAALLDEFIKSDWWAQMVAVGYEQARGLRKVHEKADGFAASVSKTFDVPLKKLYAAWDDAKARAKWLREHGFTVRKATPNKSMRLTWTDGETHVDVNFYAKGAAKSQVAVQHTKLGSEADVAKAKASWKTALDELGEWLAKQG